MQITVQTVLDYLRKLVRAQCKPLYHYNTINYRSSEIALYLYFPLACIGALTALLARSCVQYFQGFEKLEI